MNSFFPALTLDTAAAKSAASDAAEYARGQRPFVAFAETQDDGSRTFDNLKPSEAGNSEELRDRFDDFSRRAYQMALHRDAIYGAATRGELLAQSLRTQTILLFDFHVSVASSNL